MGLLMIGQTISHYKILEKLGEGGMSPACHSDSKEAGRQNRPPALYSSGTGFEDPPSFEFFVSADFLAEWRRCGL